MAQITLAEKVDIDEALCQGDIFKNIKYSYIDSEDEEGIDIIELEFPLSIIVSQACDVSFMSKLQKTGEESAKKYMPSILMCPIYEETSIRSANHLTEIEKEGIAKFSKDKGPFYASKERNVAEEGLHYRFHQLKIHLDDKEVIPSGIVDFKHCFTVPAKYLLDNIDRRVFKLQDLFAEQITLKFATYLSRVAIP